MTRKPGVSSPADSRTRLAAQIEVTSARLRDALLGGENTARLRDEMAALLGEMDRVARATAAADEEKRRILGDRIEGAARSIQAEVRERMGRTLAGLEPPKEVAL
jgi:hypothetical protein